MGMSDREALARIAELKDKHPDTFVAHRREHLVHQAFALINADVERDRVPWNKCMDCGQTYVIGRNGGNIHFCSVECEETYRDYLGV